MRIQKRRRTLSALMAFAVIGGTPASATGHVAGDGHGPHHAVPAAPATYHAPTGALNQTAACSANVSCGYGCTADFTLGFCTRVFKWSAQPSLGGVELGPAIQVSCSLCECWYMYEDSNFNSRLIRKTSLRCGGDMPGTEFHVE